MNTEEQAIQPLTGRQRLHAWGVIVLAVMFWLIPMMMRSLDGDDWIPVPKRWSFQTRCAGLFSLKADEWRISHIQVRVVAGTIWQDLRVEDFSPMGVFGYRQKLDDVLEPLGNKSRDKLFSNLSAWVADRWRQLYPEHIPVTEVRFLESTWSASKDDALKLPAGAWVRPPVEGMPSTKIHVLATYRVGGPGQRAFKIANEPLKVLARKSSNDGKSPLTPPPAALLSPQPIRLGNEQNRVADQSGRLVQMTPGMPDPMPSKQRPTARGKPGLPQQGAPPRVPPTGAYKPPGTQPFPPSATARTSSAKPSQKQTPPARAPQPQSAQLMQTGANAAIAPVDPNQPEVDPMLKFFGPRPQGGSLNPPFIPAALPGESTPLPPDSPPRVAPAKPDTTTPRPAAKGATRSTPPARLPKSASSRTEAAKSTQP